MRYTIHNLQTGLFWDDTYQLFRVGGLVPLYNTEEDARLIIDKENLEDCEVLPVLLIPSVDD